MTRAKARCGLVAALSLLAASVTAVPAGAQVVPGVAPMAGGGAQVSVEIKWGVQIPMRDGVKLHAVVYEPAGRTKPLPVIVTQTPYTADEYHRRAMSFASRGYVYVIVDVRGRGNSEGVFGYHAVGGVDGHDVVEWLARQPFCDGQVAGQGGSYAGTNQWLTAGHAPKGLRTIAPRAAAYPGLDVPMRGGITYTQRMTWIASVLGVTANDALSGDRSYWVPKFAARTAQHLPYRQLDRFAGMPSEQFQTWMAHPSIDGYYDTMRLTPAEYGAVNMPVLSISGYYDGSELGILAYHQDHLASSATRKAEHYLILGPWDHSATGTPRPNIGGVDVGSASLIDINDLHVQWYDWVMKAGAKPAFLKDRVAYFMVGANAWRYAPTLEAVTGRRQELYFASGAGAGSVRAPGRMAASPGRASTAKYVYDPLDVANALRLDPVPFIKGEHRDARAVEAIEGTGVVYETAPLEAPLELAGIPKLTFWATLNVPDTDFSFRLYEVAADGASTLLTSDMLRARYRTSLRQPELLPIGKPVRFDIERFNFFARRVAAGSRLRLVIAAPNSIFVERNYNSGGLVADETAKDARTATVVVHQGGARASRLSLPIAAGS